MARDTLPLSANVVKRYDFDVTRYAFGIWFLLLSLLIVTLVFNCLGLSARVLLPILDNILYNGNLNGFNGFCTWYNINGSFGALGGNMVVVHVIKLPRRARWSLGVNPGGSGSIPDATQCDNADNLKLLLLWQQVTKNKLTRVQT